MIHVGIDLGTTNSLISYVNAYGQPTLCPDTSDASQFSTPSVVYIGPEGTLVGRPAEMLLDDAPELPVVRFVKGKLADHAWQHLDHKGRPWSAEGLSALILRKLMGDADLAVNEDIGVAMVAVPAQFNDDQRKATLHAARLAGIHNARLIDEPVAAATFYGVAEGGGDRTLLVYDFGGGTFDVTVLQTGPSGLYVLATDGIAALGGRDIDEQIMAIADDDFRRAHGRSALDEAGTALRLRRLAEQAKLALGQSRDHQFRQSLLLRGVPFEFCVTRSQFDRICAEAVARSIEACARCLRASGLGWRDVDRIVLTGGSSLLAQVTRALLEASGKKPSDLVLRQPHQAVAYGAAAIASRLGSGKGAAEVRQVAGFDLCMRVWDPRRNAPGLEVLVPRNSPLPATYSRTFYTNRDGQTRVIFELVQRRGDPCVEASLGHHAFGPLADTRRNRPIEVTVKLDSEGMLRVEAIDPASGQRIAHSVDREGTTGRERFADEPQRIRSAKINV